MHRRSSRFAGVPDQRRGSPESREGTHQSWGLRAHLFLPPQRVGKGVDDRLVVDVVNEYLAAGLHVLPEQADTGAKGVLQVHVPERTRDGDPVKFRETLVEPSDDVINQLRSSVPRNIRPHMFEPADILTATEVALQRDVVRHTDLGEALERVAHDQLAPRHRGSTVQFRRASAHERAGFDDDARLGRRQFDDLLDNVECLHGVVPALETQMDTDGM